jgi:hypothetical protein
MTISRVARGLLHASIALLCWLAIMVAMPFVGPSGRQVAVVGDPDRAVRIIAAAAGELVEVRRGAVLARASPAALYRAGAWLVIEGRIAAGCFPLAGGAGASVSAGKAD